MKYFLDTEFHEYKKKPLFGKPIDTIELISIGIVSEDAREYYAICKEFDLKAAWNNEWLRKNVLKSIFNEFYIDVFNCKMPTFNFKDFEFLINKIGKTSKQIAEEIIEFTSTSECRMVEKYGDKPQFYGYYADYDWVVFCWLFGKMIDLPKGFPMYCIDLKQSLDQLIIDELPSLRDKNGNIPPFEEGLRLMKLHRNYPIQSDEHHSLKDIEWIYKLYKFLNSDIYGRY